MTIQPGPLNQSMYNEINRALGSLNEYQIKIDMAERAGHDVSGDKAALQYYREFFEKNKAVYFPDKH
jgi:hypothetical protein